MNEDYKFCALTKKVCDKERCEFAENDKCLVKEFLKIFTEGLKNLAENIQKSSLFSFLRFK